MPQFLRNCGRGDIRGRPAGRLSLFLGCARGATELGFRFLRKATKGAAFGICQPFEKGWTENLGLVRYSLVRKRTPRVLGPQWQEIVQLARVA